MLRLVLPKGSLEEMTMQLFDAADLAVVRRSDRDYQATIDDPRVASVAVMRPQEIPRYIEDGHFDLGIAGQDWVAETGADVEEIAPLPIAKVTPRRMKIALAMRADAGITRPEDLPADMTVTTEYTNLTKRYFERLGKPVNVIRSYGSNEAKVSAGIVDATVHNTETGETFRRNGLEIVDVLMESWTVLIANKKTMQDAAKSQAIDELHILLDGALRARGRVLVKMNVPKDSLEAVLEVVPSMKAPTVAELAGGESYAVETVVPKSEINTLIPQLKARGATDIIELPISKIVP
jgi:ATP phosphoribosyltransferase